MSIELQWPHGTTCARKLRYTGFTIVQLDTYELHYLQYRSKLERALSAKVDRQKLKIHFFSFNFFFNFYFIYLFMYFFVHTPSNQHFKAFLVSKFNSETSFLYQLLKENSNFIVTEPCKVISKYIFYNFQNYLYLFESLFMHLYTFISTF